MDSATDLLRVCRVETHLMPWRNSLVTKPRTILRLGRVTEVVYSRGGVGKLFKVLYAYSGGDTVPYFFGFGTSALCPVYGGFGDRGRTYQR